MNGETDGEAAVELSVGDFAENLERLIKNRPRLADIALRGEISEWKPQSDGSVYFKLKDERALLECYAFGSDARRFPRVEEGSAIVARGSIEIRKQRSSYQLLARALSITGEGELYAEYQALIKKLRDEGLFAIERKRPLPQFPRRVALISAKQDAALDFETILKQKAPYVSVKFLQSRVGGKGAELEVFERIDEAERAGFDLVVITRGGGSFEDFQPFNTESLARRIFRARIPIVTALGHTRDRSIADFVADVSVETPSAAADRVARGWVEAINRLRNLEVRLNERIRRYMLNAAQNRDLLQQRLASGLSRAFVRQRDRLVELERRLNAQNPAVRLAQRDKRLAVVRERLPAAWQRYVSERRTRLQNVAGKLALLDPEQPLARGYALIFRDGTLVRSARDVNAGDEIVARLGHGTLDARVETVRDE